MAADSIDKAGLERARTALEQRIAALERDSRSFHRRREECDLLVGQSKRQLARLVALLEEWGELVGLAEVRP